MELMYKYVVRPYEEVVMHKGAIIYSVDQDSYEDEVAIWAAVDPNEPMVVRKIETVMTGGKLPEKSTQFIGTVRLKVEGYAIIIIHVFDHGEAE